jgi:hypothetical protein
MNKKAQEMSNDVSWAIGKFFYTLVSLLLTIVFRY